MNRTLRTRLWPTWLALWALVWAACLPTLSQAAVQLTDRQSWVEVCTSTGMVWVRADMAASGTEPPATPTQAAAQAGCTWCLAAGGHPALPTQPHIQFTDTDWGSIQVASLSSAWVVAAPHSLAQSRAPPSTHA
jgi:hypothetical protein